MRELAQALAALALLATPCAYAQGYPAKPMLAPAATPREIINTLAGAVAKAARAPDMRQRLIDQGAEPMGSSADEFAKLLKQEQARWAEVVKVSGAKAD